ncbi:MAG TPA: DciA family protein [Noviherbaspirillum sp.]|nr:DciA family protein [Noviherbaspirillum sp.]
MRNSSFRSTSSLVRGARANTRGTREAADFLRSHDRMAALVSVAERLAALDRDCASLLPTGFSACRVLHLDGGQLVLAVPGAAWAAKLKQQLPRLQDGLVKRGWQVNAIRLKVQGGNISLPTRPPKQLVMPATARQAFQELESSLDKSKGNEALKGALRALLERHGPGGSNR